MTVLEEGFECLQAGVAVHWTHDVPGNAGVVHPTIPFWGKPAGRDDDVDMGIPFEVRAERVEDKDQARQVPSLSGVGQECVFDGAEEGVQADLSVHADPIAQFDGDGEDEVLIGDVEDVAERRLDPAIYSGFAAGGAETGLACVGDASNGVALKALVFRVAEAVTAHQHAADVPEDRPAQEQDVGGPKSEPGPAAQEDLTDGDGTAERFQGDRISP